MSELQPPFNLGLEFLQVAGVDSASLLRHLEQIDLLLQRYFYLRADYGWQGEVVLSMLDIEERLAAPQGQPAWLSREQQDRFSTSAPLVIDSLEPLGQLIARFDLSIFEVQVLLLGALLQLDSRYRYLFSAIQGKDQGLPTYELALNLFCNSWQEKLAAQARLQPGAPLLDSQLLQTPGQTLNKPTSWSGTPFLTSTDIWHFLTANPAWLPRMGPWGQWISVPNGMVQTQGERALLKVFESTILKQGPAVLTLKQATASQAARVLQGAGWRALSLTPSYLPLDDESAIEACQCTLRNARLYDAALLLQQMEALQKNRPSLFDHLVPVLTRAGCPLIILVDRHAASIRLPGIAQITFELPAVTARERAEALCQRGVGNEAVDVPALCRRFSFMLDELDDIQREVAFYQQQAPTKAVSQQAWMHALRDRARQNFGNLAQRITPRRCLDDLIISQDLYQQLSEILAAIRYREALLEQGFQHKLQYGTGISALFHGPSGTGKTMAAEVLAQTMQVDLIKIDLSAVVNKYVGETEKNLARIFDLAEADAGVLFFDEADALFGKRSEVKDAQDRHANIEVSYLLQRLESFPGVVVLATNNRGHMDEAFIRRFTFVTRFLFPDAPLRERMWHAIWPEQIQVDPTIDFADLSHRIEVTGASIRNIAVLASWLARSEGKDVVMLHHLEQASLRELAKAGRLKI